MGELEEAKDLLRMALESDLKSFEPEHPYIAIRQSNLALVLRGLRELEKARELSKRALESAQKCFKPGDPTLAIYKWNLASVLRDMGEFEEAMKLTEGDSIPRCMAAGRNFPGTSNPGQAFGREIANASWRSAVPGGAIGFILESQVLNRHIDVHILNFTRLEGIRFAVIWLLNNNRIIN